MAAAGISGQLQGLSGKELLGTLNTLECSGTLWLEQPQSSLVALLHEGNLALSYELGERVNLADSDIKFHFEPHGIRHLPSLKSGYLHSSFALLRAIPELNLGILVDTTGLDMQVWVAGLEERGFNGTVALRSKHAQGCILFHRGQMVFAAYEDGKGARQRADAVRAIYSQVVMGAQLYCLKFEPIMLVSLLGLMYSQRQVKIDKAEFTGVEVLEEGFRYYRGGQVYLQVEAELIGDSGFFTSHEVKQALPFPSEPLGWELQRFALTLRGQDVLNPMTELSMEFNRSFEPFVRELLLELAKEQTIAEAALAMDVDIADLHGPIKTLEREGFVKMIEQAVVDFAQMTL